MGLLDPAAKTLYQKNDFKHLYYLECESIQHKPDLYNLLWLCPNDDLGSATESHKTLRGKLHEPQDLILKKQLIEQDQQGNKTLYLGRNTWERFYLYQTNEQIDNGFLSRPASYANDKAFYLESRHPVLISNKKRLSVGQVSDVHLSARQHLLARNSVQLIPGAKPEHSPYLGELCHRNLASLERLIEQLGEDPEVDLILCTGDIQDHCINADPAYPEHQQLNTPGQFWRAMHNRHHQDKARYPRYLDAYMMLSLIYQLLDRYQKPLLFIDGNHEAYDTPYGISPRVKAPLFGTIHNLKANAGIPADHNLSIQEAGLVYGYDYAYYEKTHNFEAENQNWIRQFFSPLKDWVISYADQQTFIGLGWGDDEGFLEPYAAGGGALPRATESCTKAQLELIRQAVEKDQGQKLLMSHFTFVNYATDKALDPKARQQDPPEIDASSVNPSLPLADLGGADRTPYDEGSFYQHREILYKDYLKKGKIHYSFAGHSHRAGVYQLTSEAKTFEQITVQGHYPDQYQHRGEGACLIVSGSGGPFSKQNQQGEYQGQGSEPPQGIKLNTQTGQIQIIRDQQAKPRMAVLLEYLWYANGLALLNQPNSQQPALEDAKKTIEQDRGLLEKTLYNTNPEFSFMNERFLKINLGEQKGQLNLEANWIKASEHGAALLDSLRLHLHQGGKAGYLGYLSLKQSHRESAARGEKVIFTPGDDGMDWGDLLFSLNRGNSDEVNDELDPSSLYYFLSIHLKQQLKGPLHDHYDYQTPWCFAVNCEIKGDSFWITRIGDMPEFEKPRFVNRFKDVYDYTGDEIA